MISKLIMELGGDPAAQAPDAEHVKQADMLQMRRVLEDTLDALGDLHAYASSARLERFPTIVQDDLIEVSGAAEHLDREISRALYTLADSAAGPSAPVKAVLGSAVETPLDAVNPPEHPPIQ